ncbi:unnamed protein product [Cladocopium goreaui]|uniref:Uncharacterized protein n=1 Tax=Cladocopium goreaui TaxID=2562237 RepID=A0A9P1G5J2_9DINO|nr:unnamed protein product [Cladocopium goreaui]
MVQCVGAGCVKKARPDGVWCYGHCRGKCEWQGCQNPQAPGSRYCSGTCSNDRYLEPKCATVGCVRRSTTTSRWCGPYYCKDYEGRPMKAPPEAYGGA